MELLFKPKDRNNILMDIAKRKSAKNRAFLIALSIYHEDIFDKFFTAYLKFVELDVYSFLLYSFKSGDRGIHVNTMEQAVAIVRMFAILGFDISSFAINEPKIWKKDGFNYRGNPSIKISIKLSDISLLQHYIKITQMHQIKRKKRVTKKKA